jgi:hypothetical protein
MLSELWVFLRNGLPLWNISFTEEETSEMRLDQTLISGLLTASSNFTQEALGGKLKDLIMENELLHQYPILQNRASFAVLVNKSVDIEQLDGILEKCNQKIISEFQKVTNLEELMDETDVDFQLVFQRVSPPIFEDLILNLKVFIKYQEKIHGNAFDHSQIIFLKKIPELAPILNSNKLGLIMRDITTRKTHLFQNYANLDPEMMDEIESLVKNIEKSDLIFNMANLSQYVSFANFGTLGMGMFLIHQNLFVIIGKIDPEKENKFDKLVKEIKKKLETFIN